MIKNMGTLDKVIRLTVVAIIAYLYYTGKITGTLSVILAIVAVVFALTSLIGFCPLYKILGINTCSLPNQKK